MGTFLAAMGVRAKLAGVQETCLCLLQAGDIVFCHRETVVIFQNTRTGIFQQSRDPRNVYYHAWKTCIASCFMDFNSSHISIDESVRTQLNVIHIQHLYVEFGLKI